MADKEVIIKGKKMMYGTGIKASPETNSSSTPTFDGVITQGSDKIPWTIEISKVRYEDMATHKELSETVDGMLAIPEMVTVREVINTNHETYTVVENFYDCLTDGNDYEINPDEQTVENLKFRAARRERKYE